MDYQNGGWVSDIETLLNMNKKVPMVRKFEPRKKEWVEYLNIPCAFDIETSSFYSLVGGKLTKQATMYIWMLGINGNAVYGRTWAEFIDTMNKIVDFYNLGSNRRLVCGIHNLAYEFAWMYSYFEWDNIFAREKGSPMRALTVDGIEFRCTYMLSGQSLAGTCQDLTKYKLEKKVGDLDYDKIRHSSTPLSDKEMGYCLNDVLGVMSFLKEEMEQVGDDITKIPMTKTGKVRTYLIDHCLKDNKKYRRLMQSCRIGSVDEYHMMKRAYTGGFTHACAEKCAEIWEKVMSWDFTSSYPTVLLAFPEYPIGSGKEVKVESLEHFKELSKKYFVIVNVEFEGLYEKVSWEHYFSASKCYWRNKEGKIVPLPTPSKPNKENPIILDNGRVVSADHLITTICHIDWDIISAYYTWDSVTFGRAYVYPKGYLPKEFIECALDFYEKKTTLKDQHSDDGHIEVVYQLLKGMLNSLYGAVCTDIASDIIGFEQGQWTSSKPNLEEVIDKYNNSKKRWGFWPWAVACTALARRNLFLGITEFGKTGDYLYSDTDSVKVLHADKHMTFIENYNKAIIGLLERMCDTYNIPKERIRPKTIKGKEKPLGVWDDDGHYTRFKTLGAKRYLVEHELFTTEIDGKEISVTEVVCTIAGSNKRQTSRLMNGMADPFAFFDDEMEIDEEHSCRKIVDYQYHPCDGEVTDYLGNTGHYHEESYVHMESGKYSLKINEYYKSYIKGKHIEVSIL